MEEFESPIDKIIREAQSAGSFDNLPGKGRPIEWQDESHIPEDQRMARRLLKQNQILPEWMLLGEALDLAYQQLRQEYKAGRITLQDFESGVRRLNLRLVGYNMSAPRPRMPYSTTI